MRPFYLSVQARSSWFYIYMLDTKISKVPVKFGLEFVAVIRANRMNAKGELMNHIVYEFNCILLGMPQGLRSHCESANSNQRERLIHKGRAWGSYLDIGKKINESSASTNAHSLFIMPQPLGQHGAWRFFLFLKIINSAKTISKLSEKLNLGY